MLPKLIQRNNKKRNGITVAFAKYTGRRNRTAKLDHFWIHKPINYAGRPKHQSKSISLKSLERETRFCKLYLRKLFNWNKKFLIRSESIKFVILYTIYRLKYYTILDNINYAIKSCIKSTYWFVKIEMQSIIFDRTYKCQIL